MASCHAAAELKPWLGLGSEVVLELHVRPSGGAGGRVSIGVQ